MKTGFFDKNGHELSVGDKIKVPDNPDIAPWDEGIIELRKDHGISRFKPTATDFLFVGNLSLTPLDFYKQEEIEKLNQ